MASNNAISISEITKTKYPLRTAKAKTRCEINSIYDCFPQITPFNLYNVYWEYQTKPISDLSNAEGKQREEDNQHLAKKREELTPNILVEQISTCTLMKENEKINVPFSGFLPSPDKI